jgi:hypothetical protein
MKHTFILFFALLAFSGISLAHLDDRFISASGSFCADEGEKDKDESTKPSDDEEEPDCD